MFCVCACARLFLRVFFWRSFVCAVNLIAHLNTQRNLRIIIIEYTKKLQNYYHNRHQHHHYCWYTRTYTLWFASVFHPKIEAELHNIRNKILMIWPPFPPPSTPRPDHQPLAAPYRRPDLAGVWSRRLGGDKARLSGFNRGWVKCPGREGSLRALGPKGIEPWEREKGFGFRLWFKEGEEGGGAKLQVLAVCCGFFGVRIGKHCCCWLC